MFILLDKSKQYQVAFIKFVRANIYMTISQKLYIVFLWKHSYYHNTIPFTNFACMSTLYFVMCSTLISVLVGYDLCAFRRL